MGKVHITSWDVITAIVAGLMIAMAVVMGIEHISNAESKWLACLAEKTCAPYDVEMYNKNLVVCRTLEGYEIRLILEGDTECSK